MSVVFIARRRPRVYLSRFDSRQLVGRRELSADFGLCPKKRRFPPHRHLQRPLAPPLCRRSHENYSAVDVSVVEQNCLCGVCIARVRIRERCGFCIDQIALAPRNRHHRASTCVIVGGESFVRPVQKEIVADGEFFGGEAHFVEPAEEFEGAVVERFERRAHPDFSAHDISVVVEHLLCRQHLAFRAREVRRLCVDKLARPPQHGHCVGAAAFMPNAVYQPLLSFLVERVADREPVGLKPDLLCRSIVRKIAVAARKRQIVVEIHERGEVDDLGGVRAENLALRAAFGDVDVKLGDVVDVAEHRRSAFYRFVAQKIPARDNRRAFGIGEVAEDFCAAPAGVVVGLVEVQWAADSRHERLAHNPVVEFEEILPEIPILLEEVVTAESVVVAGRVEVVLRVEHIIWPFAPRARRPLF